MSNISHHFDFNEGGCCCGSSWEYMDNECSYVLARQEEENVYASLMLEDEDIDFGYFECSHGHAHCSSHK